MTEESSRTVQQTSELAHELNLLSDQLAGIVGRFRLGWYEPVVRASYTARAGLVHKAKAEH